MRAEDGGEVDIEQIGGSESDMRSPTSYTRRRARGGQWPINLVNHVYTYTLVGSQASSSPALVYTTTTAVSNRDPHGKIVKGQDAKMPRHRKGLTRLLIDKSTNLTSSSTPPHLLSRLT
jgi:hypothetical protein